MIAVRTLLHGFVFAAALGGADAHAQFIGGAPTIELPLLRLAIGFALCALLAVAAAFALRRLTKGRGLGLSGVWRDSGRITVAESRRVSMHADICRVICGDREYFVIVSASAATVLRESALPPPTSEPPP